MQMPQTEPEAEARRLLEQGQTFLAYTLAQAALLEFPESVPLRLSAALALLRAGALGEARDALEDPALAADHSEETLGLRARVLKEAWLRSGLPEDARPARDAYRQAFHTSRGPWTGINAATLSWIVGDRDDAEALAQEVLEILEQTTQAGGADPFWHAATRGEALLLLERDTEAEAAYAEAASLSGRRYASFAACRRQVRLLAEAGLPVSASLSRVLAPPTVVVFAGHMLDLPGRQTPRFPPEREKEVRQAIAAQIDALDARIGYCSAACGSDILFLEAMRARGAEVNIVLPYAQADFLSASVAFAGPEWVERFHQAIAAADSVRFVTEESVHGDSAVFGMMGQVLRGFAFLAGQAIEASVHLLAVWDGQPGDRIGCTADQVAHWPDPDHLHLIPLTASVSPAASLAAVGAPAASIRRQIKTLLFADMVGYSRLQEDAMPAFMFHFLSRVVQSLPHPPVFVNTWGDAIFAIMDDATSLAEYALALQEVICNTDWAEYGLPAAMSVRIGLHAGPVYEGLDPITRTTNYYGSHVNRASRLEAVTVPGNVYASEQFAALLTSEQQTPDRAQSAFTCQYVGVLALSKDYGHQATYHLRRQKA